MDGYPKSRIPKRAVVSLATFGRSGGHPAVPSIRDAGELKFVTSGRVAIALALQRIGAGRGHAVLVPAYHCSSMIDPVRWAGADPVFYRVRSDLGVDIDDIRARIGGATRALLVAHYFGFHQDMPALRALCDDAGIALIEDCAHAFFGTVHGRPPGWHGDYAIASSMKFFPVFDGGCIASARHPLAGISLRSAGLRFELKAAFNTLEEALHYDRLPWLGALARWPIRIKDALWRTVKRVGPQQVAQDIAPGSSGGGRHFDAHWIDKKMSLASRFVLAFSSRGRITARRRANYQRMLAALGTLPGARPLFRELPAAVVPYVFALVVDDPARVFDALKRAGVPAMRWDHLDEGMDRLLCPVSVHYSLALLQFPVHEELSDSELEWMIGQVGAALAA